VLTQIPHPTKNVGFGMTIRMNHSKISSIVYSLISRAWVKMIISPIKHPLPLSFRASEASRGIWRRMDSANLQTGELKDRFFVRFLTRQTASGFGMTFSVNHFHHHQFASPKFQIHLYPSNPHHPYANNSLQNLLNRVLLNLPRVGENDHLANQALSPLSFRASEASRGIWRRMDSANLQTGELKDRFFVRFLTRQTTSGFGMTI